ncbi:hypothetical protein IJ182_10810 [bacterium]|nr:hypothetical protein [bacterium]
MKQKIIALIDGNNFFASCEILMNPRLKGKPVCVLSNNDGCVIARSNEAKKIGITMGMPYFMAKKSFPEAVYLSANFALYHDISQRMIQMLGNYSDKIDVYSIDEAFIDITGLDKILKIDYYELAQKIKYEIEDKIGISVSVGIASSKVLAKVASHKAKKLNGVYFIETNLINAELAGIPVEDIWGVGKNIARSLKQYGIFYANEICLKDDEFYRRIYGKKGLELKYELMGKSVIPLSSIVEKPKSIQRTRAFPEFSKDKNYIMTELEFHLHNVCKKLRENGLKTSLIYVMLRTKDFRVFCLEKKLDFNTDSEILLIKYIRKLFDKIFLENVIYRSSGVYAGCLTDRDEAQLCLFPKKTENKCSNISSVVDKIEYKYGKGAISFGTLGLKNIRQKHKRIVH